MSTDQRRNVSEAEAREVAEASRQKDWKKPSFMRNLFLGSFTPELLYPFPRQDQPLRPEYQAFMERLKNYLLDEIDPLEIDETGELPENIIERLGELGALGMNLPSEYGGQGFSKHEYCKTMELSASYEGSMMGFLSPHQSVGVPECLKLFGTESQKRKYLPLAASTHVTAFALTEPDVGSDPARLTTSLETTPDGSGYLLNGEKLWCTNGLVAKLLVVMARHKETGKISAVVVETEWAGVEVVKRCRFMGLSALQNGVMRFENVHVPKENLIGEEGAGLRIALTALNTGRLSIPYGSVGGAKKALECTRTWAAQRTQWGKPLAQHEAIALKLAKMGTTVFAMEAIAELCCHLADEKKVDIRLEAAAAKEYNTCRMWEIIDETMQIRGGRGYEKERSLMERGEAPMPVERMMRDARVSKIFEGASEIMHLLIAREAVDKHLQIAGAFVNPKATLGAKLAALPKVLAFYATWYPKQYFGPRGWFGFGEFGELAPQMRFVERHGRYIARQIFHAMAAYGPKLERKQGFLFRWVDIAMELFAMTVVCSRAQTWRNLKDPRADDAFKLAENFCRNAQLRIGELERALWTSPDDANYALAQEFAAGKYAWLEDGIITLEEANRAQAGRDGAGLAAVESVARF